ncbi:hypothetical protein T4A_11462 [Trichinella pseudospiralis]|uniref:Peptidase S1 domain-containing protein n=1 Tax=Trichinella pseudospiralis TaxID=6337 RepID=A0A0V1DYJ7_TRIPS|nr:hypothetical protein T4A_11462 [Trichinella pseudospiralis]
MLCRIYKGMLPFTVISLLLFQALQPLSKAEQEYCGDTKQFGHNVLSYAENTHGILVYPWNVLIATPKTHTFKCLGSLIAADFSKNHANSSDIIITAGSCFRGNNPFQVFKQMAAINVIIFRKTRGSFDSVNHFRAYLGTTYYRRHRTDGLEAEFASIYIHTSKNGQQTGIAFAKLKQPVVFGKKHVPICLAPKNAKLLPHAKCYVTGYSRSTYLVDEEKVFIISSKACKLNSIPTLWKPEEAICGKRDKVKDVEMLGAPLMCFSSGKVYQFGVFMSKLPDPSSVRGDYETSLFIIPDAKSAYLHISGQSSKENWIHINSDNDNKTNSEEEIDSKADFDKEADSENTDNNDPKTMNIDSKNEEHNNTKNESAEDAPEIEVSSATVYFVDKYTNNVMCTGTIVKSSKDFTGFASFAISEIGCFTRRYTAVPHDSIFAYAGSKSSDFSTVDSAGVKVEIESVQLITSYDIAIIKFSSPLPLSDKISAAQIASKSATTIRNHNYYTITRDRTTRSLAQIGLSSVYYKNYLSHGVSKNIDYLGSGILLYGPYQITLYGLHKTIIEKKIEDDYLFEYLYFFSQEVLDYIENLLEKSIPKQQLDVSKFFSKWLMETKRRKALKLSALNKAATANVFLVDKMTQQVRCTGTMMAFDEGFHSVEQSDTIVTESSCLKDKVTGALMNVEQFYAVPSVYYNKTANSETQHYIKKIEVLKESEKASSESNLAIITLTKPIYAGAEINFANFPDNIRQTSSSENILIGYDQNSRQLKGTVYSRISRDSCLIKSSRHVLYAGSALVTTQRNELHLIGIYRGYYTDVAQLQTKYKFCVFPKSIISSLYWYSKGEQREKEWETIYAKIVEDKGKASFVLSTAVVFVDKLTKQTMCTGTIIMLKQTSDLQLSKSNAIITESTCFSEMKEQWKKVSVYTAEDYNNGKHLSSTAKGFEIEHVHHLGKLLPNNVYLINSAIVILRNVILLGSNVNAVYLSPQETFAFEQYENYIIGFDSATGKLKVISSYFTNRDSCVLRNSDGLQFYGSVMITLHKKQAILKGIHRTIKIAETNHKEVERFCQFPSSSVTAINEFIRNYANYYGKYLVAKEERKIITRPEKEAVQYQPSYEDTYSSVVYIVDKSQMKTVCLGTIITSEELKKVSQTSRTVITEGSCFKK